MRLDVLFSQLNNSIHGESQWDSRNSIHSLLDILNIVTRMDIKKEIMKELERHSSYLARLESNPNINQSTLGEVLNDLDLQIDRMHTLNGQVAQRLRENDFLSSIRQRATIPGGACHFDLPGYHYWLMQPAQKRITDLQDWMNEFAPIKSSVSLILRLIRESSMPTREIAEAGFFQSSLDSSMPYQLIRVTINPDSNHYAEISAGKHRFTVRFLEPDGDAQRPTQTSEDIEFDLTCCAI